MGDPHMHGLSSWDSEARMCEVGKLRLPERMSFPEAATEDGSLGFEQSWHLGAI